MSNIQNEVVWKNRNTCWAHYHLYKSAWTYEGCLISGRVFDIILWCASKSSFKSRVTPRSLSSSLVNQHSIDRWIGMFGRACPLTNNNYIVDFIGFNFKPHWWLQYEILSKSSIRLSATNCLIREGTWAYREESSV